MEKNKTAVAKKTLHFLKKNDWEGISYEKLCLKIKMNLQDKKKFKKKIDFIININNYFDYLMLKSFKNIENSNSKDMLFEILMIRFDILSDNRKSILNLFYCFKKNPKIFFFLLPSFLESSLLIADNTKIKKSGITGTFNIKAILLVYFLTFFSWIKDETEGLDKTMMSLDNYLNKFDNILKI